MPLDYDDVAGELFDFAVTRPDGFTNEEALPVLNLKRIEQFNKAVRRLRLILEDDTIQLVCDPQGSGEDWLYRLVGNLDDAGPWVNNRLRDLNARLETQHAVAKSLVTATDGRTIEGRKARLVAKTLGRLREDLDDVDHWFRPSLGDE